MRNQISTLVLVVALASLPAAAAQAQTIELSANADCDGWNAISILTFPAGVYYTNLEYSVVLRDQAGFEMTRFDFVGQVSRFENPVMTLMHGDAWGLALDSAYVADFVFLFLGVEASASLDLACGAAGNDPEPGPEPCRQSPGFWKNNAELWPVEFLSLGGIELDQDQLIQTLRKPVRGNGSLLLARELIAAKLNVANGCDDFISSVIDDADLYLVDHPLNNSFWRNRVPSSRDLRIALSVYNKADCSEPSDGLELLGGLKNRAAASEQKSFSSLKAMYR